MKRHLLIFFALATLSGCTSYSTYPREDMHSRVCSELKSHIIFDGNTSITRKSEIEGSEQALYQRSYEDNKCE